ncbi:aspartate kinase [Cardiobacterium valvarum]|uniref:Aspartokinase n=1 Tax=Cardiobacterium valvarum F0432 TaxID=797473 RepID=G9ZIH7_9GAMM|nr:aspartate kinase [Cardiobacterium valvarum]EHM51986.1 aspartate kinase, monofunctional class [Cardiobacterium valvarum F0432]
MALIVQKYGGTSMGSIERIEHVAEKCIAAQKAGNDLVVAVSAMSGETNRLIALAHDITPRPSPREMDVIMSTGEQVSIALLAIAIEKRGIPAVSYTGAQVKILTDSAHMKARIKGIDSDNIKRDLQAGKIVIVAGFQGVDEHGNITTLGRGGSDTTAVSLAAALHADECQIYTDVDGVYTTDPRIEPKARKLDRITFEEMLEMASLGSKVLQIRSVEFAGKYKVPLRVLSSFEDGEGTLISLEEENPVESAIITGIAFSRDEAQVNVVDVPDTPGIAYKILAPIGEANINVDMIIQNIGIEGKNDFTFTVPRGDYDTTLEILRKTFPPESGVVVHGSNIAKVSIVGVGMRSHAAVASTMFQALAKENINIHIISTSEIKISVGIDEKYLELAVRALHEAFGLDKA